ncbi:MAG: hypothetical protein LBN98_03285 [Prevotellaceae bacterium]|jgi:hypothetical protein|nr:hypothetical protein [Prevotellaceae bacterium]
MKIKNIFQLRFFFLLLIVGVTGFACNPAEDDRYTLGGETIGLPADWTVTAIDNNNEVVVSYAPLDNFIDGTNVLAVQFNCPEAGISFVVKKGDPVAPKSTKVYRGGDYVLYVAAITRAGAGTPKEVPFTVTKNLLLETLSEAVLPETVTFNLDDAGHKETFYKGELYIESSSFITLEGALASDDVIVNLDFFSRENTTTVKFLGESGVYSMYWNPVRKNVIIEPTAPIEAANGYYVFTGPGLGYPTTVSSDDIKAAYGAGEGRYTTWWEPGNSIRSRVVMRRIGDDTYQATVCINTGATFKPFSNANWGNDVFAAQNCTFSGSLILNESGDWSPNENCDKEAYYRFVLNAAQKTVEIRKVSATGEVLPDDIPEEPEEPVTPPAEDSPETINFAAFTQEEVDGEKVSVLANKQLEKDFEYTLVGSIENAEALFNVDFFERTALGKVKFTGETGEYTLYYNAVRKNVIIEAADPQAPGYLLITGVGMGYPTKVTASEINAKYPGNGIATLDNWNFDNVMEYILMRKTGDNTYQATVMIPFSKKYWWDGGPYVSFKVYTQKNTDAAYEMGIGYFTGGITGDINAGIITELLDGDGNLDVNAQFSPVTVRITVNTSAKSMTINTHTL